jgi:hypothetical protein
VAVDRAVDLVGTILERFTRSVAVDPGATSPGRGEKQEPRHAGLYEAGMPFGLRGTVSREEGP